MFFNGPFIFYCFIFLLLFIFIVFYSGRNAFHPKDCFIVDSHSSWPAPFRTLWGKQDSNSGLLHDSLVSPSGLNHWATTSPFSCTAWECSPFETQWGKIKSNLIERVFECVILTAYWVSFWIEAVRIRVKAAVLQDFDCSF
jgi:hypothetical protein